jgi:aromatic ring hydroxylase
LAAEANNIARASHVKEKLSEFAGAAELAFAAGRGSCCLRGKDRQRRILSQRDIRQRGRRLTGELIYHEYNILTEIAGGIAVTMPFDEDFEKGDHAEAMKRFIVRNPNISSEESLKIWQLVENIGVSSMASWYKIAGVHGGGSPIMETIALNIGYDFKDKKALARYLAGIDGDLDDSAMRDLEPKLGAPEE